MKFLFPLTIFMFCVFQIHFILSNKIIENEKLVNLSNLRNMVKISYENLNAYLKQEFNYTDDKLHNLAKELTQEMIILAFSKNSEVQIIKQTENCSDTSFCRNDAYRNVLELIDNHNKSLIQTADESMRNIIKNSQLTIVIQMGAEILLSLNSEFPESNDSCFKNHSFYETTDDCLNDKKRTAEFFLDICILNEQIFRLENSLYLQKKINNSYLEINKKHISLLSKLGNIKSAFDNCTHECIQYETN
ncbi:uncharacterized protein LOC127279621 [Leptopilina boulardi]|uniref:uncharacterized protein LOC127279621 n=1 Tax=Leptopilina boulardi TaxID=63433 RepID=UPI0021F6696C|nr:uncharacterized protein LOC127279621 [Leptopilina boulardi]